MKDAPADRRIIGKKITDFFEKEQPQIPGISGLDFANAIHKALEKIDTAKFGIPLPLTNRLFTVNGSFADTIGKSPRHLLLPYCSKSLECGYRYERDCIECGECSIGEAYRLGKEKKMWITTILSFEDLMETLKDFRKRRISSYIGCCCEAFYTKHLEDFERSGVPGILIDIDNTTCYDLGKEKEAYKGNFESQTDINIDLLKKVLDAKL